MLYFAISSKIIKIKEMEFMKRTSFICFMNYGNYVGMESGIQFGI